MEKTDMYIKFLISQFKSATGTKILMLNQKHLYLILGIGLNPDKTLVKII